MSQNIIEKLREEAIRQLFKSGNKFSSVWPIWQTCIHSYAPLPTPTARQITDLGDHLREIFYTTANGRGQGEVSAGGANWEALVCWYLNLCNIGRRTVVIKHNKQLIPTPISDAITVNYGNYPSNTESDLIAITFPNLPEYTMDKDSIQINDENGQTVCINHRGTFHYNLLEVLNALVARDFAQIEIHIIQCKTNWRDNAQIPMLWDMVYKAGNFESNITVGQNNYSLSSARLFTYAFATVPTGKDNYTPTSTPVCRVRPLSGGNYWGKASSSGIASSLKEMLSRNLQHGDALPHMQTLANELPKLQTAYSYFNY